MRNPDWIAHTFVVPDLGVDLYVGPQSERSIDIAVQKREYAFEYTVTGHENMVGRSEELGRDQP